MIQPIPQGRNGGPAAWQRELSRAFRRPADLLRFLDLPPHHPGLAVPPRGFGLRVPRGFASRMRKGDPRDPLLRQVWPAAAEDRDVPGYDVDAVGDLDRLRDGGVIQKYQGRALIVTTGACAVHCRYCFRRHFPYAGHQGAADRWNATLRAIANDPSVDEVILSGGDPLSLTDERLGELADALDFLPHLRRLRIHTRLPIVLPERVDDRLLAWLGRGRLRRVMVVHANHPREVDGPVAAALRRLADAGVPLLNQAVLLRGVNDDAPALIGLFERLFELRVMPYYLHMLDRVRGAAHFEVREDRARALWGSVAARLPGYLLPRLVREVAGAPTKVPLTFAP